MGKAVASSTASSAMSPVPARSSPTTALACPAAPPHSTRTGSIPRTGYRSAWRRRLTRSPAGSTLCLPAGANRIGPPVDWIDPPHGGPHQTYPMHVSAVDPDGNETAGLRLPPIAVPLGTHTGWNVYKAQPDELADRDGSFIAFARSRA